MRGNGNRRRGAPYQRLREHVRAVALKAIQIHDSGEPGGHDRVRGILEYLSEIGMGDTPQLQAVAQPVRGCATLGCSTPVDPHGGRYCGPCEELRVFREAS